MIYLTARPTPMGPWVEMVLLSPLMELKPFRQRRARLRQRLIEPQPRTPNHILDTRTDLPFTHGRANIIGKTEAKANKFESKRSKTRRPTKREHLTENGSVDLRLQETGGASNGFGPHQSTGLESNFVPAP